MSLTFFYEWTTIISSAWRDCYLKFHSALKKGKVKYRLYIFIALQTKNPWQWKEWMLKKNEVPRFWERWFHLHGRLISMMTSYYLSRSIKVAYSRWLVNYINMKLLLQNYFLMSLGTTKKICRVCFYSPSPIRVGVHGPYEAYIRSLWQ